MEQITLNAYAKINLFLEVTGKRPDGFHSLVSYFQSVSLCDILTLKKGGEGLTLSGTDKTLSYGEDNLVLRAMRLFEEQTGIREGVSAYLDKRIPMQAGLGGGSADAAAALRGMNILFSFPLSEEEILALCARLGSDVPFCYRLGSARGEGRGEILSDSPALPPCFLVVAIGEEEKMSTSAAYARLDSLGYLPVSSERMENVLKSGNIKEIGGALFNRFADGITEKEALMRQYGAVGTLLCGSGAAVFGIFERKEEAEEAKNALLSLGARAFVAEPI